MTILGFRDLTEIQCRIQENAKFLDGERDLTSTGEERFIRIFIPGMGCIIREKTIFGIEMAEIHDAGLSLKKERQFRIRKPFQIRYKYNNSNNSLNNDLTHLQIG